MSFRDLPADWPRRPLTDLRLARDVLDLCVSDHDRRQGGLCLLSLRENLCLAQPFFVRGPVPRLERRSVLAGLLSACMPRHPGGGVVLGVAHIEPAVTDDDHDLHHGVIEACRGTGLRLLSSHLVSTAGVEDLPLVREVA